MLRGGKAAAETDSPAIDPLQRGAALQNEGQCCFTPPRTATAASISIPQRLLRRDQILLSETQTLVRGLVTATARKAKDGELNLLLSADKAAED